MDLQGAIVGEYRELFQLLDTNMNNLEFVGAFTKYFSNNLLMRLFSGSVEKRAIRYMAKKAKKEGANVGVLTSLHSCSSIFQKNNDYRMTADFYQVIKEDNGSLTIYYG